MFFIWIGIAVVTAIAAASRGRGGVAWFFLGMIFSVFALIVVLVLPALAKKENSDTHVRCPDCRELVLKDARVCKHCKCKLVPQVGGDVDGYFEEMPCPACKEPVRRQAHVCKHCGELLD